MGRAAIACGWERCSSPYKIHSAAYACITFFVCYHRVPMKGFADAAPVDYVDGDAVDHEETEIKQMLIYNEIPCN